jgi:hypothetical protein
MEKILALLNDVDSDTDLIALNNAVVARLKSVRAGKAREMKRTLNVNDRVQWTTSKRGNAKYTGTVVAIKRKFAHVDAAGQRWRVPMTMLKVVS